MVAELLEQEWLQEGQETPSTCVSDLLAQCVANVDLEELVRIPMSETSRQGVPLSAGASGLTPCMHLFPADTPSRPLRPLNLFGDRAADETAPPPPSGPSSTSATASFLDKTDLLQTIGERARQIERDVSTATPFTAVYYPLTEEPVCFAMLCSLPRPN